VVEKYLTIPVHPDENGGEKKQRKDPVGNNRGGELH
jgi:hypothetical protein